MRNAARPRGRRLLKAALAAVASLSLAFAGVALEAFSPSAPAAVAGPGTIGATTVGPLGVGAYNGTVPAGICSVTATVVGGAGGSAVTTTTNANGAGASITATFPVLPGWTYGGTVGGGGGRPTGSGTSDTAGPGGSNGGGAGGTSGAVSNIKHHGAGGGGYTDLSFNGTLAVLAGGGGGAGGGHSTGTDGTGGNAGLPTTSGVTNGQNGFKGKDYPGTATVTGGTGGSSTAGAGGVNSQSTPANGFAGSGRTGGAGGNDTNPDAGGGGGGGYAGGGGGASTLSYNTEFGGAAGSELAGAGGGGGSSYVAPSTTAGSVSGISSVAGPKITTASSAAGANGSLTLTWIPCSYDLSVTKSVSAGVNGVVTWTVAVTNNGPSAMTQGDTVTITDDLPGAGTKTVTSITTSGGSNTLMANGAMTCGAIGVGSTLTAPATIDCSRPYQPVGGAVSGVRGLNVGETLTITYTQPISGAITNTVGVTDRPSSPGNNSASASVTPPVATNDQSLGNALYTPVGLNVAANDSGTFGANPVTLWNAGAGAAIPSPYLVPGEGTWMVSGTIVTFTPLAGFRGDPAPVSYRITASNGLTATATVTITYVPVAVDDLRGGLVLGTPVTLQPLANDDGDWAVSSLRLMDGVTPVTTLAVPAQGIWTVTGADITFTPDPGFLADPTPVTYRITDSTGDTVSATVTLDYGPTAADDSSLGNALGTVVSLKVYTNDIGDFDSSTLGFGPGNVGIGASYTAPGEGTWDVSAAGIIRFTPLPGFLLDPAPVTYFVDDVDGDSVSAVMRITYVPDAHDDSSLGNPFGSAVNVPVLANDNGDLPAAAVRLVDGATRVTSLLVAGEGTWEVQPDGSITFTPLSTFLTDPADVRYAVTDPTGDEVTAQLHITYLPLAVDDAQGGLVIGSSATVPVLANDHGDWDVASLRLLAPGSGLPVLSVAVPGEGTWTVSGSDIVFVPEPGFLVDPAPIDYRVTDTTGDQATATITVDYGPAATDDSRLGNAIGTVVTLSVFANDSGSFDDTTLGFGGATGAGAQLVVAGEGTWEVLAGGVVRFTPEPGFLTDPTPVRYYASDVTGDPVDALITLTYLPEAADDSDLGNALGTDVNVDVLANDTGDWAAGTVRLMDGILPVLTLTVSGEGTWTVEADDTITFAPEPGFLTDPAVVYYRVVDTTGDAVSATITVTYLPQATDNSSLGHAAGTTVNVDVLGNDTGSFVLNSIRIIDPATLLPVLTLTVSGEGEWRANADGTITFVPEAAFYGDPTTIDYEVTDVTGDTVRAQLRLAYVPVAALNQSAGNVLGAPAVIDPLANDTGTFDPTTVRIVDPGTLLPVTSLLVPGEGQWDVDTTTGVITFTPAPGFTGNPTTITYEVTDVTGDTVQATITVSYLPQAVDDEKLGNPQGDPVDVLVLPNDLGSFAPGTARLMSGGAPTMTLTVPGEGTWQMNAPLARVTFTPLASFTADPTPVPYRVTDVNGNQTSANITISYLRVSGLAYTGLEAPQQLAAALGAIALGLIGVAFARLRRVTARHRA